jgi:hypothetical protein
MSMLPPSAGPSGAFKDLVDFLRQDNNPKRFLIAAISLAIPMIWVALFLADGKVAPPKPPEIIYIRNLPANVSAAELKKMQAVDQADYERRKAIQEAKKAERRRKFKELKETLDGYGL